MDGPGSQPLRALITEPGPRMTGVVVRLLRPLLRVLTYNRFSGLEHIPATGGVIVAANHISNFDPLAVAHFCVEAGRWPYFLAKSTLFSKPVLGWILRSAEQIQVQRGSLAARDALQAAQDALTRGRLLIIYPEGTITADPAGWPMTAQPGAVRLALQSGAPLIPVGQWGAQAVLGSKRLAWPRLIPKPTIAIRAGAPVDLGDLRPDPAVQPAAAAVDIGLGRLMRRITELVGELREEPAPAVPFDFRAWREQQTEPGRRPRQGGPQSVGTTQRARKRDGKGGH